MSVGQYVAGTEGGAYQVQVQVQPTLLRGIKKSSLLGFKDLLDPGSRVTRFIFGAFWLHDLVTLLAMSATLPPSLTQVSVWLVETRAQAQCLEFSVTSFSTLFTPYRY